MGPSSDCRRRDTVTPSRGECVIHASVSKLTYRVRGAKRVLRRTFSDLGVTASSFFLSVESCVLVV